MKTLLTSLGALLLLFGPAPAQADDSIPQDSFSINFAKVEFDLADPGRTGLEKGRYTLSFSRDRLERGQSATARVKPARGGDTIEIESWSWGHIFRPAATGCGERDGQASWSFGPRSRSRIEPRPDGSRILKVVSQEGPGCQFSLLLPAVQAAREAARRPPSSSSSPSPAAGSGQEGQSQLGGTPPRPTAPPREPAGKGGGSPQPLQQGEDPVRQVTPPPRPPSPPSSPQPSPRPSTQNRPNVLTAGEKPPQCAPPEWQPEPGSPQPSLQGPMLTSSPADPPDAGCDLGGFLTPLQIQQVRDPALRNALQSLRNELANVSRSELPSRTVKRRIARKVNAVSSASRDSSYSSRAAACEWGFNRCQSSCDSGCCCCTAHYAACVVETD